MCRRLKWKFSCRLGTSEEIKNIILAEADGFCERCGGCDLINWKTWGNVWEERATHIKLETWWKQKPSSHFPMMKWKFKIHRRNKTNFFFDFLKKISSIFRFIRPHIEMHELINISHVYFPSRTFFTFHKSRFKFSKASFDCILLTRIMRVVVNASKTFNLSFQTQDSTSS